MIYMIVGVLNFNLLIRRYCFRFSGEYYLVQSLLTVPLDKESDQF